MASSSHSSTARAILYAFLANVGLAITKKLLWESPGLTPEDVERKETALHHVLMGAPDAIEGGVAYVERRRPEWTLRVGRDWPDWPR